MKIKLLLTLFIFYNLGKQQTLRPNSFNICIDEESLTEYHHIKIKFNDIKNGITNVTFSPIITLKKSDPQKRCKKIKLDKKARYEDIYITSIKTNKKNHDFSIEDNGEEKIENGIYIPYHNSHCTLDDRVNGDIPTFNLKVVTENSEIDKCESKKDQKQKKCVCRKPKTEKQPKVCFKLKDCLKPKKEKAKESTQKTKEEKTTSSEQK